LTAMLFLIGRAGALGLGLAVGILALVSRRMSASR
jgi:hypothetical protein